MKKHLPVLIVSLLFHFEFCSSQTIDVNAPGVTIGQIVNALDTTISPLDTNEGGQREQLKYFNTFFGVRLSPNDSTGPNMFEKYYTALNSAIAAKLSSPCSGSDFKGNWTCLGPNKIPGMQDIGKVNSIWVDPDDSDYILVGAGGGLFRTHTGGYEWECITDNTVITGGVTEVSGIAVNQQNKHEIYIASSGVDELIKTDVNTIVHSTQYGAGILKSFDGGETWQQEFIDTSNHIENDQRIFLTPDTGRIYVFKNNQIWTRSNPTGTWTNITPSTTTTYTYWIDLQFDPSDQTHFFVSSVTTNNDPACIYESNAAVPADSNWSLASANLTSVFGTVAVAASDYQGITISLPIHDTLYAVAMKKWWGPPHISDTAALFKCYLSPSGTRTWTQHATVLNGINPGSNYMHLVVSPANTRNIYYGGDIPIQSRNWGNNFTRMASYTSDNSHPDIRALCLQLAVNDTNGLGDRLFLATDGGVGKKASGRTFLGDTTIQDISGKGLACGEVWALGINAYGSMMVASMQHDGFMSYESDKANQWINLHKADYYEAEYDDANDQGLAGYANGNTSMKKTDLGTVGGEIRHMAVEISDGDIAQVGGGFRSFLFVSNFGKQVLGLRDIWVDSSGLWLNKTGDYGLHTFNKSVISGMEFNPYSTDLNGYVLQRNINDTQTLEYIPDIASGFTVQTITTLGDIATCVTMSPQEPQKVWLGMNGQGKCQVAYSTNYGHNQSDWYDVSYGLPANMPVSKLIYQENAGDVVFCGTEIGVYRCDFGTFNPSAPHNGIEWKCFNSRAESGKYFPNVFITDMKINYCQGKLYAATFGRGIWVSDLYPEDEPLPQVNTISSSTTITGELWPRRSLYVPPGVTLTLSGATLHMPRNSVISVDQGARLIVNNSTLTNDCDNCMWRGIEAWGDHEQIQTPSHQGWVRLTNSTVEHAKLAVCNYNPASGAPGSAGGIIQATNTKFLNNSISSEFIAYHNYDSYGMIAPNISYFSRCTFLIDDKFKGSIVNAPFKSHIKLTGVEGVNIVGCSFFNRKQSLLGQGNGIEALNSGFAVKSYCAASIIGFGCYSSFPSYFSGFMNSVLVQGVWADAQSVVIDEANFDSTGVGINVQSYDNVSATRNKFLVGRGYRVPNIPSAGLDIGCGWNIGILINSASTFNFENNTFSGRANINGIWPWYNIGTMIANTGSLANKVYLSTFDTLSIGVLGAGNNHIHTNLLMPDYGGLQILCNSFNGNFTDIVSSGQYNYEGIGGFQGNYSYAAGNTFANSTTNILNTNPYHDITYLYQGGLSYFPFHISGHISLVPGGSNGCQSHAQPFPSPFDWPNVSDRITAIIHHGNTGTLDSLTTAYMAIIDGGRTTQQLDYIDTATNANAMFSVLDPLSPYLSDTVLKATINSNVLSSVQLDSLLVHNPEALQHYSVYTSASDYFNNKQAPQYIANLDSAAATATTRSSFEAAIAEARIAVDGENRFLLTMIHWPLDTLVSPYDTTGAGICTDSNSVYYMLDSNMRYWQRNNLDPFLTAVGGYWAQYARMGYLIERQDYSTASTLFSSIDTTGMNADELNEYHSYDTLWSVLYNASTYGRNIYTLNKDDIDALDTGVITLPAPAARVSINNIKRGPIMLPMCDFYEPLIRSGNKPAGNNPPSIKQRTGNSQLIVYPNPSSGLVTFEYNVPRTSPYEGIRIIVTDILGKKVMETNTEENSGLVYWDPKGLSSGVYLYKAINGKGVVGSGKLMLTQ